MTQEEKAKAYDEALKDMRAIYPNLKGDAKLAMEHAFPELRESEDEMVRKTLIDFASTYLFWDALGLTREQVITYLEKQKEQKPAEWSEVDRHNLNSVISLVHGTTDGAWGSCIGDRIETWLKYLPERFNLQSKQEWSEEDEEMLVHVVELLELNCDFSEINNEISWLKSLSRKKIWNKEDERILKGIVGLIDHNQHYDVSNNDMLNWLKSLRPQPKREIEICPHSVKSKSYSETGYPIKDCDYGLEIAADILRKTRGKVQGYQSDDGLREHDTAIAAVENADKSLRPHWKPSEEDLDAIKELIDYANKRGWVTPGASRLYEQLKAL